MIEIEIQNETHQTQHRIRFAAVPRIGEGLRLRFGDGEVHELHMPYQQYRFAGEREVAEERARRPP